jgi:hypothetical protein
LEANLISAAGGWLGFAARRAGDSAGRRSGRVARSGGARALWSVDKHKLDESNFLYCPCYIFFYNLIKTGKIVRTLQQKYFKKNAIVFIIGPNF